MNDDDQPISVRILLGLLALAAVYVFIQGCAAVTDPEHSAHQRDQSPVYSEAP